MPRVSRLWQAPRPLTKQGPQQAQQQPETQSEPPFHAGWEGGLLLHYGRVAILYELGTRRHCLKHVPLKTSAIVV